MNEVKKKTRYNKPVIHNKFYEVKYEWGSSYRYGYSWLNDNAKNYCGFIDIICHDGGVTQRHIDNVIFIRQIHQ